MLHVWRNVLTVYIYTRTKSKKEEQVFPNPPSFPIHFTSD